MRFLVTLTCKKKKKVKKGKNKTAKLSKHSDSRTENKSSLVAATLAELDQPK